MAEQAVKSVMFLWEGLDGQGKRMKGEGVYAEQIHAVFELACRRTGIDLGERPELSIAAFRRPSGPQLSLFES